MGGWFSLEVREVAEVRGAGVGQEGRVLMITDAWIGVWRLGKS